MRVATANVNGIRAATRRGFHPWLRATNLDIVALQEVRAPTAILAQALSGWTLAHHPSQLAGRAGVAVASSHPIAAVRVGLGLGAEHQSGRWVEADVVLPDPSRPVTVVSAYVPVGELDSPKQVAKYEFLDAMTERLGELFQAGGDVIVGGDINVAHREADLKNWRGNIGKRGFLEAERAYIDRWLAAGWVDVGRALAGDVPGPYTWWSWRGKAFDSDAGWRIDCQFATPGVAARARAAQVHRAATYAERWSDHAPLVVTYA